MKLTMRTVLPNVVLQRMIPHDDLVTVYAREWESFRLASEAANYTCEYLNRMILKTRDRHAKATIGDSKLRRQSVEAVRVALALASEPSFHVSLTQDPSAARFPHLEGAHRLLLSQIVRQPAHLSNTGIHSSR